MNTLPDLHDHAEGGGHDHPPVMALAENYCRKHGASLTPIRRRVLAELAASAVPLSAYDLTSRLHGPKKIAPVQVYRALEFLQEAGVIHRLATRSAFIACGHVHAGGETIVFLVCGRCGKVEEAHSALVERGLKGAAVASGFRTRHSVVEVEGDCAACFAKLGTADTGAQ